jgi:hypothetical protein
VNVLGKSRLMVSSGPKAPRQGVKRGTFVRSLRELAAASARQVIMHTHGPDCL